MRISLSRTNHVNGMLAAYGFQGFQASGNLLDGCCEEWKIERAGGGDVGKVISPYNPDGKPLAAQTVAMQIINEIEKWIKSLSEGAGCIGCKYAITVNAQKKEVLCFFDALGSEGSKPCER